MTTRAVPPAQTNPDQAAPGSLLLASGSSIPDQPSAAKRLSLNALKHGLTGQTYLLNDEEAAAFTAHLAEIVAHYQPIGPIEKSLADEIAIGIWRLQRTHAMEQTIFTMDAATQPEPAGPGGAWLTQAKSIHLLGAYEGRIRRALEKDKAELQSLQQARKQEAAQAMDQAVAFRALAKKENRPYQPELYFKMHPPVYEAVFSTAIVDAEAARREAWITAQTRIPALKK